MDTYYNTSSIKYINEKFKSMNLEDISEEK